MGCIPSHAAYFSAYEVGKSRLGVNAPGHHPLAAALTGACATVLHDAVSSPMDLVKQRLQLGYYKGIGHCIRSIVEAEGFLSLWRSFPATLAMNVPYASSAVAANESAKVFLKPLLGADSIFTYLASGACAGVIAAAVTTPLDVIKTRMQTNGLLGGSLTPIAPLCDNCDDTAKTTASQMGLRVSGSGSVVGGGGSGSSSSSSISSSSSSSSSGIGSGSSSISKTLKVATALWREEGIRVLFRGLKARVAVNAPSQAISWATYEFVKGLLFRALGEETES
jgi:solute carrier family 25 iron transporter 28/37